MEIWKEFEHNTTTHSSAHHLMSICELLEEHGYARITDVARKLGISRSSASLTLRSLRKKGYIVEDENKFLKLSDSGRKLTRNIRDKRNILRRYFIEVLELSAEQAEIDACKIEHLISDDVSDAMLRTMEKETTSTKHN